MAGVGSDCGAIGTELALAGGVRLGTLRTHGRGANQESVRESQQLPPAVNSDRRRCPGASQSPGRGAAGGQGAAGCQGP
uniref:Uncharacterized protein n=1 Tax=Knipowitschia caucasica TaxID=637954 RepID=A0AAV2K7V3_KNICA